MLELMHFKEDACLIGFVLVSVSYMLAKLRAGLSDVVDIDTLASKPTGYRTFEADGNPLNRSI